METEYYGSLKTSIALDKDNIALRKMNLELNVQYDKLLQATVTDQRKIAALTKELAAGTETVQTDSGSTLSAAGTSAVAITSLAIGAAGFMLYSKR